MSVQSESKEESIEFPKTLEKISQTLISGGESALLAYAALRQMLEEIDLFELSGKIQKKPRQFAVICFLRSFVINSIVRNLGEDNMGIPMKSEAGKGMKIFANILKDVGIFIQNSLFRNRDSQSMGTIEHIYADYYSLLRFCNELWRNEVCDPDEKYFSP